MVGAYKCNDALEINVRNEPTFLERKCSRAGVQGMSIRGCSRDIMLYLLVAGLTVTNVGFYYDSFTGR